MFEDIELNAIQEENARELVKRLLNMVEQLSREVRELRVENQRLRDEVNRLKGEQGKPDIKGNKAPLPKIDHSSETERHKKRTRHKKSKKVEVRIDREEILKVDAQQLPADAEYKGCEKVVVQDIEIRTANVLFYKEKYYSASKRKTYLAQLPAGYGGQFGPGIKSLILTMYFGVGTSEPKIREFLENMGVQISKGEVSDLLIQKQADFHAESEAVYEAGLYSSPWQQSDHTETRVNGQRQHCQVVCNPVYSSYHTRPKADRLTALDVLRQGRKRIFLLNEEAYGYLEKVAFSKAAREVLPKWRSDTVWEEAAFVKRLDEALPNLNTQQRTAILGAAAVAAYHAEKGVPIVDTLVCDDASVFHWLTRAIMLCWVHDGRAYTKLEPVIALHRQQLEDFRKLYWEYYDQLLAYREKPTTKERKQLESQFDTLFATETGYHDLDQRIAKTRAKKTSLLLVLQHPELPLHNNASELAVRQRVRKRDVSFGPRTQLGLQAWDTFMTLADTARKLGISFHAYIRDRVSGTNQIPPMSILVTKRARELNLGGSWG
ncbi:MAG: transposase [Anaerolineales bacterium]|nr:transposase [Anaerolineales bacterium]